MICSIKVRSVILRFETEFGSINTSKPVSLCVYCTRSHVSYHSAVVAVLASSGSALFAFSLLYAK